MMGLHVILIIVAFCCFSFLLWCRLFLFRHKRTPKTVTIGIFHPYCNAGGGGERVLWVAIKALERLCTPSCGIHVVIYTGDGDAKPTEILAKAKSRFDVDVTNSPVLVSFAYVTSRELMSASRWPRFTMLGQSLGSMVVAWEGLRQCVPDIFLDTTGCAFTFFVAKVLAGVTVATYTHYPTITADMLSRVYERRPTYNNSEAVANSTLATYVKVVYYKFFGVLYLIMGKLATVVMVNSNWTKRHIDVLWKLRNRGAAVVFPPCNTEQFEKLLLGQRTRDVVSVGQFRPEKDHPKQLLALASLLQRGPAYSDVHLVLVGGARDAGDLQRVADLRSLAKSLKIEDNVVFKLNVPFDELRAELGRCLMGIHTMWNEHFGIGVVEMMAAGVATIAHKSGGPESDIVVPFTGEQTGWLASSPDEYADCMAEILDMAASKPKRLEAIVKAARASVSRFSDEEFAKGFVREMSVLFKQRY